MSIALAYWKQKLSVPVAFSSLVIVVTAIGVYGATLIQSYMAYTQYDYAVHEAKRYLDGQVMVDQTGRVAGVKKSMAMLQDALAKDPGRAEIHFELGELFSACADDPVLASLVWSGDESSSGMVLRKAAAYYMQALERFPTNPIYQQRLGLLYNKAGLPEKARLIFAKAELLDPHNSSLRLFLAEYYWENRDVPAFDRQAAAIATIYAEALKGGGRLVDRKTRVEDFFRSIGKEELLK